ncbi:MAG TPA: hypothetical protein VG458_07275, partial [Solirubrobacterales bacterium]|nr:hypothetical protein [Solirubrobacterales bacterium]
MEGIGGQLRRMALGGGEAAKECFRVVDREQSRLEHRSAVDRLGDGGGGRFGGSAALSVEGHIREPPVLPLKRNPREIAAG